MLLKADSGIRKNKVPRLQAENEFRSCKGDFVGTVQPRETQYEFSVRDTRRQRPTIYGTGVDFPRAVAAVTQLLDALADKA